MARRGGTDAGSLVLFDDSSLLSFYCQAAAALGLAMPPYLLLLQDAIGGQQRALVYGLRATGAACGFLFLVHFAAANAVIVVPAHQLAKRPAAPLHAQHALSLLFGAQQMHAVTAAALAWLGGGAGRLAAAQAPALTALMLMAHVAVFVLARAWGATRPAWTAAAAARQVYSRPQGSAATPLAVVKACRYFVAFVFWAAYASHFVAHLLGTGRFQWHALAGALAYTGGWAHAAHAWRRRRRLLAEMAAGEAAAAVDGGGDKDD